MARAGLALLSFCLMAVLMYQAFRQERALRLTKSRVNLITAQLQNKEEEIAQHKLRFQELEEALSPFNAKKDELEKKKKEMTDAIAEHVKKLLECNSQKVQAEKKKQEAAETLTKVRAEQEAEQLKSDDDMNNLRQKLIYKNKMLCELVDNTQEVGRQMCAPFKNN